MNEILRHILTGKDNSTHDVGRWMACIAFIEAMILEIYRVIVQGHDFIMQDFGTGVGILFAGLGFLMKAKETSEPDPEQK